MIKTDHFCAYFDKLLNSLYIFVNCLVIVLILFTIFKEGSLYEIDRACALVIGCGGTDATMLTLFSP